MWEIRLHRTAPLDIFGGANRKLSEQDGLVVDLCHPCHNEPPNGVHFNKERMQKLHEIGQMKWEGDLLVKGATPKEARTAFIKRYGKNYV